MKTIIKLLVVLLLAAAGFVAYIFVTLDPEELGRRVLEMINESTGVELTAESISVRPLKGVDLENGSLQGGMELGTVSGSLDRMVVDYKLLPILQGEIVVSQILVEGPRLEVLSRPAAPAVQPRASDPESMVSDEVLVGGERPIAGEGSGFISAVSIDEIRVEDGNLKVATEGSDSGGLVIRGLTLELGNLSLDSAAMTPFLGFAAEGGIRLDEIVLDEMTIEGGRGDLVMDHGRLAVTDLGVETEHASLQVAEIAVDVTQNPWPYRLQAGGSYDLNELVQAEGEGFGAAALEFTASGSGLDLDEMVANGTFRLDDGQVPAFPMMVEIEKLVGESLIVGLPYEGTDIVFSIENGRVRVEPFVMGFENLQMAGGGTIDLAGPIDIQIDIRLPRESVSSSVIDPFIDGMTDEDGWTTVPFNIAGTMAKPSAEIDMTSIKSTAKDMGKRAVTNALDGALDDLKEKTFRRRQKDDG